ncbi:hypothetical protein ONZ51_g9095 [Trametes cubensis]|uniref:Uncharacterized protein n=1 Tax=Trametes cubensis TaxID=1111947 RepID=A0AAD7TN86_9APHY|nr:hypothetical protein ONZ51_g9095 [Trametes cubensis]
MTLSASAMPYARLFIEHPRLVNFSYLVKGKGTWAPGQDPPIDPPDPSADTCLNCERRWIYRGRALAAHMRAAPYTCMLAESRTDHIASLGLPPVHPYGHWVGLSASGHGRFALR